jgi:hypothetical protein
MKLSQKDLTPITNILGLAVIDSQRLENSIAYMMLLLNNELNLSGEEHNEKIDQYMQNLSKKTLGNLTRQLQEVATVNDEFKEKLETALEARNYIIHRFVTEVTHSYRKSK